MGAFEGNCFLYGQSQLNTLQAVLPPPTNSHPGLRPEHLLEAAITKSSSSHSSASLECHPGDQEDYLGFRLPEPNPTSFTPSQDARVEGIQCIGSWTSAGTPSSTERWASSSRATSPALNLDVLEAEGKVDRKMLAQATKTKVVAVAQQTISDFDALFRSSSTSLGKDLVERK